MPTYFDIFRLNSYVLLQEDGTELFNFVHGYQSWPDYLRSMRVDETWGDHVILHAAANCFETCIHVINSLSHVTTIYPDRVDGSSSHLVLGHLHEHHYVSLQPKPGRHGAYKTMPANKILSTVISIDVYTLMFKCGLTPDFSVPDKRGVSGQKPEKAGFVTRQIEW